MDQNSYSEWLYRYRANGEMFKLALQVVEGLTQELASEVIFPTCFETALRLRQELNNPNLSLADIARVVSVEPLVASRLTRLASSAIYAVDGRAVRDLSSAINRLGMNLVRATALSITMGQILQAREMQVFSEVARKLWDHSVRSAAAARILARTYTRIDPEEAFLAGLVHDLGAFYMLYRLAQHPKLFVTLEMALPLIARFHEDIGSALLAALGVPGDIVNAAVNHDHLRELPEAPQTLPELVHIGNVLTREHCGWLLQDPDAQAEAQEAICKKYADVMPEVSIAAQEVQSVFS